MTKGRSWKGYYSIIQQDNAKTHGDLDDPEFNEVVAGEEFYIHLRYQLPSSPDLKHLDLGFFNGIQSLRYKESPKNVDQLVTADEKAFELLIKVVQLHVIDITLCHGGDHEIRWL